MAPQAHSDFAATWVRNGHRVNAGWMGLLTRLYLPLPALRNAGHEMEVYMQHDHEELPRPGCPGHSCQRRLRFFVPGDPDPTR